MTASKYARRLLVAFLIGLLAVTAITARPVWHLVRTAWRDADETIDVPTGFVDDASRLNQTVVSEVWSVPADAADAEAQLAELLKRARTSGTPVSIAGARHSMGGHSIAPNGIVIDMRPFNRMHFEERTSLLTVQAGATWKDVIVYLDARGRSVAVMQSNNSFTIGGSLSVNCHGWTYDRPPIASTVESFRLMAADGTIRRCSRDENPELFSLVLGGYGLFGILLDAELHVVPNARYRLEQHVVPTIRSLETFEEEIEKRPDVRMTYARMNVSPDRFLGEAVLNVFVEEPGEIPSLAEPGMVQLRRTIFRGSADGDYGKSLRWAAETDLQPWIAGKAFSRNQLMNESVDVFANRSADTTDILHEYFVPREHVAEFVEALREIVPRHEGNLLNVTIRLVNEDEDTFLRYADGRVFAFVMLFLQDRTPASEARMQTLTRELIDAAIACGGRYYLPYRLHATPRQFHRAYPQARAFFERKRKYDPHELFRNQFYRRYGARDKVEAKPQ